MWSTFCEGCIFGNWLGKWGQCNFENLYSIYIHYICQMLFFLEWLDNYNTAHFHDHTSLQNTLNIYIKTELKIIDFTQNLKITHTPNF